MLEKNIYDKIADILTKIDKDRTPKIKKKMSESYVGGSTLVIDIPKKYKELYHSSGYSIDCNDEKKKCDISGNLVTKLGNGAEIKNELEKFDCEIMDIHNWDGEKIKSTHVHFRCKNLDYNNTLKITKFIKKH